MKTVLCLPCLSPVSLLLSSVLFCVAPLAHGQPSDVPLPRYWQTDGPVNAMLVTNGVTFLGGTFGYVGPESGNAGVIDLTTAQAKRGFPRVDGEVLTAAADGAGGWYIGGTFTDVGGVTRTNLAHILADNTVDAAWSPNANGACRVMTTWDGRLYVGGTFTRIGTVTRNRLAAFELATGALATWNPGAGSTVHALALDASGTTLYVGGSFTTAGSSNRTRIAALNLATGYATSWNPGAGSTVYTLAVDGNTVYAGGGFGTIGGLPRNRIAALDATTATGQPTGWNPNILGGTVSNLVVCGDVIFVGGGFTSVAGITRNSLAAIDRTTGLPTDWNPNPNADVTTLVLTEKALYVGGTFTTIGGATRGYVAALDATNGTAQPWSPTISDLDRGSTLAVYATCVSGGQMLVGGSFVSIGGARRNNLAAVNNANGEATDWNPNGDATVSALAFAGNTLYAGGSFTNIGGQVRNRLAALSESTGQALAWDAGIRGRSTLAVSALAVLGNTLYVGGVGTTSVGGQSRTNLYAVSLSDALPTTWNPPTLRTTSAGSVNTLAVDGDTIILGGDFTSVAGQSRTNLAALSATDTGTVESWSPNPNGVVYAVAVRDGVVYAGGTFTSIGTVLRNRIAAVDRTTGISLLTWNPDASGSSARVSTLALGASALYVGGQFTSIGGAFRTNATSLRITTGQADAWQPRCSAIVRSLALGESKVFTGGDFLSAGGDPYSHVAAFETRPEIVPGSLTQASGAFGFRVRSGEGNQFVIQRSSNLEAWVAIATNSVTGSQVSFTDPEPVGAEPRFYRTLVLTTP